MVGIRCAISLPCGMNLQGFATCAIADQGLNLSKAEVSGAALQSLAVAQDRRLGIREVEQ
jgi:hypothetical protein